MRLFSTPLTPQRAPENVVPLHRRSLVKMRRSLDDPWLASSQGHYGPVTMGERTHTHSYTLIHTQTQEPGRLATARLWASSFPRVVSFRISANRALPRISPDLRYQTNLPGNRHKPVGTRILRAVGAYKMREASNKNAWNSQKKTKKNTRNKEGRLLASDFTGKGKDGRRQDKLTQGRQSDQKTTRYKVRWDVLQDTTPPPQNDQLDKPLHHPSLVSKLLCFLHKTNQIEVISCTWMGSQTPDRTKREGGSLQETYDCTTIMFTNKNFLLDRNVRAQKSSNYQPRLLLPLLFLWYRSKPRDTQEERRLLGRN